MKRSFGSLDTRDKSNIAEMEKMLNDKFVISQKIKAMSKEERLAEIKRLEEEAAKEKQRILKNKAKA